MDVKNFSFLRGCSPFTGVCNVIGEKLFDLKFNSACDERDTVWCIIRRFTGLNNNWSSKVL